MCIDADVVVREITGQNPITAVAQVQTYPEPTLLLSHPLGGQFLRLDTFTEPASHDLC